MSIVGGFPQGYHHHHHQHHLHHSTSGTGPGGPSASDAAYVSAAAAYYQTNAGRYESATATPSSGTPETPYFSTWAFSNAAADSNSEISSGPEYGNATNSLYGGPNPSGGGAGGDYNVVMGSANGPNLTSSANSGPGICTTAGSYDPPTHRFVKRRVTANRKERRRTLSINTAFADLRECIPNVPSDTKLSKIKTLRLATSYIAYLMDILAKDDPSSIPEGGFKAEVNKKIETREERKKKEMVS